jgi:hypothetical protein
MHPQELQHATLTYNPLFFTTTSEWAQALQELAQAQAH